MSLFKHFFSKSLSTQLTVTSNTGFHLRPVAQFASLARSFPCRITAASQNKTVDAKAVNSLLSLSLEKGDTFRLSIKGKNAEEALGKLHQLFETLMSNDKESKAVQKTAYDYEGGVLEGEIISQGIAIAPAYRYSSEEIQHESDLSFREALDSSLEALESLYTLHKKDDNASIYLAQRALLSSLGEKSQSLKELEEIIKEASTQLIGTKLASKRGDYQDILQRVKKHLGLEVKITFPDTPFILLCHDLLPSEIDMLLETKVLGVILKETSVNSHTAILLRAAGLCSLIADTETLRANETLILDTHSGVVVQNPSSDDQKKANKQLQQNEVQNLQIAEKRFESATTTKGKKINVFANVADVNSAKTAK